ncbi:MAG: family 43 glycosylhydrolase, partial [Lachnospiraceae bacterium]|nr:family 43 glycosylhydrolase [Lachnospiraceae bacterium]
QYQGELYFIWSGWSGAGDENQRLYIAHMSGPCTIDSNRVQISAPTYAWEWPLEEGPFALVHDGRVFVLLSGNRCWTDEYCIGYLELTGEDPLRAKSWEKHPSPILRKSDTAYGPGHCSVTEASDGSPWIIYHANLFSGTGQEGRSFWMQELKFDAAGKPAEMSIEKVVQVPLAP